MNDTERLNLIEHYQWNIVFVTEHGYSTLKGDWCSDIVMINGKFGSVEGNTIREAVDAALKAQMNWSLGKS